MEPRRPHGHETLNRLLEWQGGQNSERLAAAVLATEGFNVDPSHPFGGKDGGKDAIVTKDGVRLIAAVYFPRGQQQFAEIKRKLKSDFAAMEANEADGFVFFTNQELRLQQRTEIASVVGGIPFELYHLERITNILNTPQHYGTRLEFLQIAMTHEEIIALYAQRDKEHLQQLAAVTDALEAATQRIIGHTTGGTGIPEVLVLSDAFCVRIHGEFSIPNLSISIHDREHRSKLIEECGSSIDTFFRSSRRHQVFGKTISLLPIGQTMPLTKVPELSVGQKRCFYYSASWPASSVSGWIFVHNNGTEYESATRVIRDQRVVLDISTSIRQDLDGNPVWSTEIPDC